MILAAAAMMMVSATAEAQTEQRESRRAEMQARQTEALIKDLELTDEQKAKFEPIYTNYQNELAALRPETEREKADGTTGASAQSSKKEKKQMTDAEATARVQEYFTRQAEQIRQSELRLDIQKKYCAEFSAILTPQQLLKVFSPRRNRNGQGGQRGQGGGQRGQGGQGFGGPRGGGFGGGDFGGPDF